MVKTQRICSYCKCVFESTEYLVSINKGKLCSKVCRDKSQVGSKLSEVTRYRISKSNIGKHTMSPDHRKIISIANRGKKLSIDTIEKLRKARKNQISTNKGITWKIKDTSNMLGRVGSVNPKWVGESVTYSPLHSWVRRWNGKACRCEVCGLDRVPEGKTRYFQWANISGEYRRDLNDFFQLCVKCHKEYDK